MKKSMFEIIQEEIKSDKAVSLVSVVEVKGSTPQKTGAKMLVSSAGELLYGTIGGGTIESMALKQALIQINEKSPLLKSYDLSETGTKDSTGMLCGGTMRLYFDIFGATTKIYIFGAGHITQQLLPLLSNLGFTSTIIDDRHEYLEEKIKPDLPAETLSGELPEIINTIEFDPGSYMIIITYSHDLDEKILHFLLTKKKSEILKLKYLGMIGSKRKVKEVFSRLEKKGVERKYLDIVHAPIGLPIGSQTPEEIAVSIAAQLIAVRNSEE
ncbi:MAG: XdhC family protein [Candidatus Heimdallarchaeota archaeon]|nr:XdhC family protein [Candidatus Heimdallarchaeota archaeon]